MSCPECCQRQLKNGQSEYYHQLVVVVIVHPELKTVLPMMPEAITRQDGASKNDCKLNASKRLLQRVREDQPQQKFIVVADSLASNAPHIALLGTLNMRYIIGVKPSAHAHLLSSGSRLIPLNTVKPRASAFPP